MESITIKVEDSLAVEINSMMIPDYSTKTEFIREAIRDKLKAIRKERALCELNKYFGKAKTKTSFEEDRTIREQVGREYAKKHNIKLD